MKLAELPTPQIPHCAEFEDTTIDASQLDTKQLTELIKLRSQQINTESKVLSDLYWDLGEALIVYRKQNQIPHGQWLKTLAKLGVEEWKWNKAQSIRGLYEHRADVGQVGVNKAIHKKRAASNKQKNCRLPPPVLPQEGDTRVYTPLPDVTLAHCDFRDLPQVAGLKDNSVRLIVCDPPYDQGWAEKNGQAFTETIARLLQPHGVCCCCYGKISTHIMCDYFRKVLDYRWEQIILFVSPTGEVGGSTSVIGNWIDGFCPVWIWSKGTLDISGAIHDVIRGQGKLRQRLHPHQKNWEDIATLIKTYSKQNDLVADLTCGSFTTAEAAYRLGRKFVGSEIDLESIKVGVSRLEALKRELVSTDLVDVEPKQFEW